MAEHSKEAETFCFFTWFEIQKLLDNHQDFEPLSDGHCLSDGYRGYVRCKKDNRRYFIDVKVAAGHRCPKCLNIQFWTGGEHGEWWCTNGCDDPQARKEVE